MVKDSDFGVILEDIDNKLAAILEGQAAMADVPNRLTRLEELMTEVQGDIKDILIVLGDTYKTLMTRSANLDNHKTP